VLTAVTRDAQAGPYVILSVIDTGTGMSPEIMAQVFDPFFTTKPVGHGTGLGLSQVYGFAKQSGGFIAIDSKVVTGTAINLYLPQTEPGEAPIPSIAPVAQRVNGVGTVLVVEDNEAVRATACELVRELGYSVIEADTGRAALESLEAGGIDLIFTEVVLPDGMSGVDLAAEVHARAPNLSVLLTSGYTAQRLSQLHDGGLTVLRKPYNQVQLSAALRDALSSTTGN
jgi:CheY-like chemotaxis protein